MQKSKKYIETSLKIFEELFRKRQLIRNYNLQIELEIPTWRSTKF